MKIMKRSLLLLCLSTALAGAADLGTVHRVYLLPMAHGMDQYLANQLASEHVFEVVTDPKLADALFTDRLGQGFEAQYEQIFPPPPAPKPANPEPKAKAGEEGPLDFLAPTENKLADPSTNSSFNRSRGNLFLVDTKSREVVWSTFAPPKSTSGKEMHRTASDIVNQLKKDLQPKK
jgi:hypothetical protein